MCKLENCAKGLMSFVRLLNQTNKLDWKALILLRKHLNFGSVPKII